MTRLSSGQRARARSKRLAPLVLATLLGIGGLATWRV